jgi:hypothetical protein
MKHLDEDQYKIVTAVILASAVTFMIGLAIGEEVGLNSCDPLVWVDEQQESK